VLGSPPIMASTPHLSRNQLDRFEERLQRERARLLGSTQPDAPSDMPGLADPGDAADVAEEQVERATRNTLTEGDRAQLAQVNRALLKLAEGSYGLSDLTGDPIPIARLEALPWATTTTDDPVQP